MDRMAMPFRFANPSVAGGSQDQPGAAQLFSL